MGRAADADRQRAACFRFALEEGKLLVDGDIDGVQYEQGRARRRGGFLRRAIG